MLKLSINEQKQINGGTYRVKAYFWTSGAEDTGLRGDFSTMEAASRYAKTLDSSIYHVIINNI